MDVEILTMDKQAALAGFEEYKQQVGRQRTAADRLMAHVYKAVSEGHGVLNLKQALARGGVHEHNWMPKLAAMRADQPLVYFSRSGTQTSGLYSHSERYYLSSAVKKAQAQRLQFVAPEGTFPRAPQGSNFPRLWWTHSAPVPPVPMRFRPADSLSNYVTLWEVEHWEPRTPPSDPILLKPLSGDLYVVLAHWDLSPVEKMVLGSLLSNS